MDNKPNLRMALLNEREKRWMRKWRKIKKVLDVSDSNAFATD